MTDEKKKVLCPDPDCATENDSDTQFCSKCTLDLTTYFTLDRSLSIREKVRQKAEAEEKEKNRPAPKKSVFGNLAGRSKK